MADQLEPGLNGPSPPVPFMSRARLLLCFVNFGPYHRARLRACDSEVAGLQLAAVQSEYAWETDGNERLGTVFAGRLEEVQPGRWRALVSAALDRLDPEVCAVAGYGHPGMRAILAWCLRRRRPVVLMSDSRAADEPRPAWKEWIKGRIVRSCAAGFVAGTPHVAYLESLGLDPKKIFTGFDVVDNGHFARGADAARADAVAARARLGLPGNYFLVCARFIPEKNLPRLLEAYAAYRRARSGAGPGSEPWKLVLVGDGPLAPDIRRVISRLRLEDAVRLSGRVRFDDLPPYYGLAQALIHPSVSDTWGLVVNEAMAAGLPVLVSTDCGCAVDLVEPGVNGFTFNPENAEQLAGLMEKMAALPTEQRAAMGEAGRRIIARWDLARFAGGLRSAADQALETGPPPSPLLAGLLLRLLAGRA
jgi:glycosyltransferase involved in cell wall biosynthesis